MKYLFDFDGTILVDNIYPPQAMAIKLALLETHRVPIMATEQVDWVGQTDLSIVAEAAERVWDVEFRREDFLASYVEWFDKLVDPELFVRPGMLGVLEWCGKVSLVSGNIRHVACEKVARSPLSGLVDLESSAFAGEAASRTELILKAAGGKDVTYVGDTWRDIEAGREAGVWTIGLVTPKHSAEELGAAHYVAESPDALLAYFSKVTA